MLTLLHPKIGQVRVRAVTHRRNETLHSGLKTELAHLRDTLPEPTTRRDADSQRALWESWRSGLTVKPTRSTELPPLRLLLGMDHLVGHKNPAWLVGCFQQGSLPIYTPVGGSWLNRAEAVQRILKRRALDGQYPQAVATIIDCLEATARGWNACLTPFIWRGKRSQRQRAARQRRLHRLGGSGAGTRHPVARLLNNGAAHAS